jgi:MoaA/NifB/PqqE/SkfB family radical SAM enzyme
MASFTVITSYACNLRCPHCLNETHPGVASARSGREELREIPDLVAERIVTALGRRSYQHLVITGGEPLLCRSSMTLVRAASRTSLPCRVLTNGTVWSEEIASVFRRHEKIAVAVSLGAPSSESLNAAGRNWEDTTATLSELARIGIPTDICLVVTACNFRLIPQVVALARDYGATQRLIGLSLEQPVASQSALSLGNVSSDEWRVARQAAEAHPVTAADLATIQSFHRGRLKIKFCPLGTRPSVMDPFGDVYGCFYRPALVFGNVYTDGVESVFEESVLRQGTTVACFGERCLSIQQA